MLRERSSPEATTFGDILHSDVWGPAPIQSLGGKSYYVTFTDEATRDMFVFILRHKSEVFNAYKKLVAVTSRPERVEGST